MLLTLFEPMFNSGTMMRICSHWRSKFPVCRLLARLYSSGEQIDMESDSIRSICKIMMKSQTTALETTLDQSGIRVSPEIAEAVLERFEHAGILAYRFFEWASKQRSFVHTVRAHHSVIGSLAKIRQYPMVWDVVNAMRSKGILNVETFCIIMRKYARAQKVEEAIYTFNVMEKYNMKPDLVAFNALLSALCKSKNVRKAEEIFYNMKDQFVPDSKTYSILIEGWGRAPNLPNAREIYREMIDSGCIPDVVTYGIMVDVLCKAGRVDEAIGIVREMESNNCKPSSFIYSVLIHTYGIEDRIEDAVSTFLEMERNGVTADVAAYNALVTAFCKANKMKNVYRVLKEMNSKGVNPNSRTCNIIINSLIGSGKTDDAFRIFRRMVKVCEPDVDSYTMIIKMFCGKKELDMAFQVWKYMKKRQFVPNMHTFSVLINGLCQAGNATQASILLEEMIEKGIRPSNGTFGKLRHLLIKEGREDVVKFLQEKMNLLVKEASCE